MTLKDIHLHVALFHVSTYTEALDQRQLEPQNGEMSDLELVLEQAKKCISPAQIAELIENHQELLMRTVTERYGFTLPVHVVICVEAAKFWKFSKSKRCWRGRFNLTHSGPIGIGFGRVATPLVELLPIRVVEMRNISSNRLIVELPAEEWSQMFAYRLLSGIDNFKV